MDYLPLEVVSRRGTKCQRRIIHVLNEKYWLFRTRYGHTTYAGRNYYCTSYANNLDMAYNLTRIQPKTYDIRKLSLLAFCYANLDVIYWLLQVCPMAYLLTTINAIVVRNQIQYTGPCRIQVWSIHTYNRCPCYGTIGRNQLVLLVQYNYSFS
jgi:hypothetical protein